MRRTLLISSMDVFLLSPVHPTRGERHQRETHGPTARRDPKDNRLPTSLCQGRRGVGMRVKRDEKKSGRKKSVWMLHFRDDDTRG